MSNCKFCGQKAGFLNTKHKECEEKYIQGKPAIVSYIVNRISEGNDFYDLLTQVRKKAVDNYIDYSEIDDLITQAFDIAVDKMLDDGIINEDEEEKIATFREQLNLSQDVIDKNQSLQKVVKASILRDVTGGNTTPNPRQKIDGLIPFNFSKSETLIWLFQNVDFYEQRIKTHYQGGYSGVSLRIAKGVYYRTGGFRGHPVKKEEMKFISSGLLGITNKHIYFSSFNKSFRIQISKIVTLNPYEDGIGVQKDGVSSKPQVFSNIDGWFTYNLISNLNQ